MSFFKPATLPGHKAIKKPEATAKISHCLVQVVPEFADITFLENADRRHPCRKIEISKSKNELKIGPFASNANKADFFRWYSYSMDQSIVYEATHVTVALPLSGASA
ncbi:hypothetical protein ACE3NQ_10185 [Paenibacillus terreus]|uniref:Uncharacterized protein n=1 Tax=Paenibacillus terreus TaxID=1387834 RepID=A0ABV5B8S8_9BACL